MPRKPKLTPTTNDQLQTASIHNIGNGGIATFPTMPLQLPSIPLPLKEKRVKEQKVNPPFLAQTPQKKPLKIALIGTAPSSRMLAPYNDPSWTIWGCSPGNMKVIPRFNMWFEVHGTNLLWPENASYAADYIKWMRELECPVYMQDQQLVPHALTIPKDDLIKEFGPYFFTSTFAWMLGMAIMLGAEEIAMFGIDMASRDEYIIQRPGAYYFMIRGHERGCKVWAPYESDIMQPPPLYGYSDVGQFCRKMLARTSELKERLVPMRQQRDALVQNITYLEGALENQDYVISIQGGAQDNKDVSYLESLLQKAKADKTVQPPQPTQISQG